MERLTTHSILVHLAVKYEGEWDRIYDAIKRKEHLEPNEVASTNKALKCKTTTLMDSDYPPSLKKIYKPPLVLFYYGDLSLVSEEEKCVSYVGSRDSSTYGNKMAEILAGGIAKEGFTIVSGMARGIDGVATRAALDAGGKAVAVLGTGIDFPYPSSNTDLYKRIKEEGLVLSERPGRYPPSQDKDTFPARNRIIAGLSKLTIVGEANRHSGTLITVGYALDFGKDVACVPSHADEDSACNLLIRDGAPVVCSTMDALDLLGWVKEKGD